MLTGGGALALAGCLDPGALINPALLDNLGLGQQVARLPGQAPAVTLALENRTDFSVRMTVSYRDAADEVIEVVQTLTPADRTATAVICPIEELTLGDVANPTVIGAEVLLGNGLPNDPFVQVDPFGVLLRQGTNFNCGDQVTFTVQRAAGTQSGFQIFAFIQRDPTAN